ncbi:gustatory receptor for sugar taste 64a-like [Zophobas morio]
MWLNFWRRLSGNNNKSGERAPITHNCLKNVLTLAQIVGIFPVGNVRNSDPSKVEFRFKSWKILYAFLISFGFLFCGGFSFYKSMTVGILLNQLISPLFFIHAFITSLCFYNLAYKWPDFLTHWTKIEDHVLKNYKTTADLYKRIQYSGVAMVIVALLEHALSVCNYVYSSTCQNDAEGAEHIFKKQFHFIFTYMPYNFVSGLVLTFISWTATVVWNFGDIFIILISIIMTERFRQINLKMKITTEEICTRYNSADGKALWRQIREDYDNMNNIMRSLDQLLSNLVLLSYSCNLTFILIQLFNSLRQMGSIIEGIYFFYSFGFVISRIVFVSIFGAFINEESQAALPYLTSLPSEFYNEEIQRLITQIHVDSVALTGHNFFRVTKGLVLSVAAAIITYELVLIQFNQATLNKYMTANETICF